VGQKHSARRRNDACEFCGTTFAFLRPTPGQRSSASRGFRPTSPTHCVRSVACDQAMTLCALVRERARSLDSGRAIFFLRRAGTYFPECMRGDKKGGVLSDLYLKEGIGYSPARETHPLRPERVNGCCHAKQSIPLASGAPLQTAKKTLRISLKIALKKTGGVEWRELVVPLARKAKCLVLGFSRFSGGAKVFGMNEFEKGRMCPLVATEVLLGCLDCFVGVFGIISLYLA